MAATTQCRQVLDVPRAFRVVPHRIDVMCVQSILVSADDAAETVSLVDPPCVARRPGADELTPICDAALPEIGGLAGACCSDIGERLGTKLAPNERPPLAALREARELGLLFRCELQAEDPQGLADRVVGNACAVRDLLHLQSFSTARGQPLTIPVGRYAVHGEV